MSRNRKVTHTVVQYSIDKDLWTVVRTIEFDYCKAYTRAEAEALARRLDKQPEAEEGSQL